MGGRGKSNFSSAKERKKKIKTPKRKVPVLPDDVKAKLSKGKSDTITAKQLGLSVVKPAKTKPGTTASGARKKDSATFNKKTRGAKKNITADKLNISSGKLSKSTILGLESSLAKGYIRRNRTPVYVTPTKGKPGEYTVLGSRGNARIAYAQLSKYNGKIPVIVVTEGRRNLTTPKAKAAAAKKLASGGGRKRSSKKSSK